MKKGGLLALLPIFVFLALFIIVGVVTGDFYQMPALVGFIIALIVAFVQNPKVKFNEKLSIMAKSAGDENVIIMCMVFILAGAFSGSITAIGGDINAVNLGLSILPSSVAVVGLFLTSCFISISMGTSVGTITALIPIAVGVSDVTGYGMALCVGAVASGAMFGDNLSIISDTTIAASRTQGCDMKNKFRENFKIVLPAAIITAIIFFVLTLNAGSVELELTEFEILRVMPYIVVLICALLGMNVFVVLILGTILSLLVGLLAGDFGFFDIFTIMNSGIVPMFEITVISLTVAGILGLVKANGGIDYILRVIKTRVKSKRGAQLGIAGLSVAMDMSTANNTVAIVMAGGMAKEISEEFNIEPKRTASILDIFTSVTQGLIPYGAQLLTAASLALITPFEIIPYMFYSVLMAVSAILFIIFQKK